MKLNKIINSVSALTFSCNETDNALGALFANKSSNIRFTSSMDAVMQILPSGASFTINPSVDSDGVEAILLAKSKQISAISSKSFNEPTALLLSILKYHDIASTLLWGPSVHATK
jgi:hypothetical protein